MTVVARLEAILSANTRDFDRAMARSETKMQKVGRVAGFAGLAIAGGLAIGLEKSIKAALAAQASQARLEQAFKTSHLSAARYGVEITNLEASSRKLGFTDEQVKDSLGSLLIATHSMRLASHDLSIAQDVARFKHIDLASATKVLTMAMAGSQRATKQLGIDVPKVTASYDALKEKFGATISPAEKLALAQAKINDKHATAAKVIDTVSQKLGGQADAYSKTAAGGMEQFRAQLDHIEVTIGTMVLPALTKFIAELNKLLIWSQENWPKIRGYVEVALKIVVVTVKSVLTSISDIFHFWSDLIHGRWAKLWGDIKSLVMDAVNPLHLNATAAAKAVWNGFIGGIDDGYKAVKRAITGLFDKVIGWVKSALGIASPSSVFHEIGQNSIRGFINGVGSMAGVLKNAVVHMAENAAASIYHGAGALLHGGKAPRGGNNRSIGQAMAAGYGWGKGSEWLALDALWQRESGWSNTAKNPSSGAYGIPQALPESKLPPAGRESGGSHPQAQIGWGLSYISSRYGNPLSAWAHEQKFGWYDRGGWLPPGLSLALNNTGRPERVVPHGGGGGDTVIVQVGSEEVARVIFDQVRGKAQVFQRRNGRPAFGGA